MMERKHVHDDGQRCRGRHKTDREQRISAPRPRGGTDAKMIGPQTNPAAIVSRKITDDLDVLRLDAPRLLRARKEQPPHLGKMAQSFGHKFMEKRAQPSATVRVFAKHRKRKFHSERKARKTRFPTTRALGAEKKEEIERRWRKRSQETGVRS